MDQTDKDLSRFKTAYEAIYNEELTEKEAYNKMYRFSNLVDAMRKILQKQFFEEGYAQAIKDFAHESDHLSKLAQEIEREEKESEPNNTKEE